MNSEELEQSLRTEFESCLNQVFADMQQEITEFQEKIETEFERHKSQLTEVFQEFSARVQTEKKLDANFKESVIEHLRLARDEGARITATAIAEAEEMDRESAASVAGISELRDGINDISNQNSQASILKALVQHAGQFTPRGAFFIIKNEHFVGWRVFGKEAPADDQAVREVFFPISNESTLGESVKSLTAVESSYGTYSGDSAYLDKLEFGEPDKMFAIPLVARGRGVAVLYADYGTKGEEANIEALETLVRVAGLTVEVLASSAPSAKPAADSKQKTAVAETQANSEKQNEFGAAKEFNKESDAEEENRIPADDSQFNESKMPEDGYDSSVTAEQNETAGQPDYQYPVESENFPAPSNFQPETAQSNFTSTDYAIDDYSVEQVEIIPDAPAEAEEFQPVYQETPTETDNYSWNKPAETAGEFTANYQPQTELQNDSSETYQPAENDYSAPAANEYQFDANQSFETTQNRFEESPKPFETPQFQNSPFESTPGYAPAKEENNGSFGMENGAAAESFAAKPVETYAETAAAKPVRSRFSDKNVDLPIEVSEDERRLHNDARRFARLLVSEIKLYNEQKVKEGRDGSDLYERLREAIDRSREMYDKRIQPPVAAKFDYFHYELVNTLAEGDEAKLGESYSGASV